MSIVHLSVKFCSVYIVVQVYSPFISEVLSVYIVVHVYSPFISEVLFSVYSCTCL